MDDLEGEVIDKEVYEGGLWEDIFGRLLLITTVCLVGLALKIPTGISLRLLARFFCRYASTSSRRMIPRFYEFFN
jgi:hypothetical protein